MKFLVLGFYNRNNLGDEMFKDTIPKFCGIEHEYIFIEPSKIKDNVNLNEYDSIIFGGGDIINEYFMEKITPIIKNYSKPIYALGVGIPFKDCIYRSYLDIFDHVFIREKEFTSLIQKRLGSIYSHYIPDLGFSIDFKNNNLFKKSKKIGIFLAQSYFNYKPILFKFSKFLKTLCNEYEITFYKFNTSGEKNEDDETINAFIYNSIKDTSYKVNIENDTNRYDTYEMLQKISELDFSICFRFHSAIFSTIARTPFITISSNRKIIKYMEDNGISNYHVNISLDKINYKPNTFNLGELKDKFEKMVLNREYYTNTLDNIYKKNNFLISNSNFNKIFSLGKTREKIRLPKFCYNENVNHFYDKYKNLIQKKAGIDVEKDENISLNFHLSQKISKMLCFDITEDSSSIYEYGNTYNLMKNNYNLRDIISWIFEDMNSNYNKYNSKICLNYIAQDTFRNVHRSGWQYVIDNMQSLNNYFGVIMDTYVDKTFTWANYALKKNGIIPYTSPWVGFIHHTFEEDFSENNNVTMLNNKDFIVSLEMCKGIYVMSKYLKKLWEIELRKRKFNIPINYIKHPTQFVKNKFTIEKFLKNKNKKLINIGAWYRNCFSLYVVPDIKDIKKCYLKGNKMENYFMPEDVKIYKYENEYKENEPSNLICRCNIKNKWVEFFAKWINEKFYKEISILPNDSLIFSLQGGILHEKIIKYIQSVEIINALSNEDYDDLLSENIVFLDLVSASACNTIIECIVRNTPILINYIEPVVEVLGEAYPLYYKSLDKIPKILNESNIKNATKYLSKIDKSDYKIENFIHNFKNSDIYKNL